MDYFIPSEIARLVLGYLKEEHCTKSYNAFVNECIHLREYASLLRCGREYPTTIADRSLKQILNDYGKHKQHEARLKSNMLDGLWLKHDALITQIRGRCTPSTPSVALSSGCPAAKAQGQRSNRSNRPNAMAAVDKSRATVARQEFENRGHRPSLSGSPAPTEEALEEDTVASDSEDFVVEASQSTTPSGRCRNQHNIRTMSPKALGGILVDISQVEERCSNLDDPASFSDCRQDNAETQSEAVPSTSTGAGLSQENTFTNHQRKATSEGHSNVQRVKTESVVKPKQTPKLRKGKRQVRNGSQEEEVPVATQQQCAQDQSTVSAANAPDVGARTEPTLDCITPKKSDPRTTAIAIGKSPRRKGPAPKRRSACWDDPNVVPQPITTNSNSSNEETLTMPLSMPCFDDLINNLNLAEKLAQTINEVKQSAESAVSNTVPAPVPNRSQPQPEPAPRPASPKKKKQLRRSTRRTKKDTQPAAAAVSTLPMELSNEENIGNVLHLQDSVVTQEAVKSIMEMTKSDPDFDILFHMFNSDKPISFDEVEEPGLSQTSLPATSDLVGEPVASTSMDYGDGNVTMTMTANYQASPQMATVLHPGRQGQPDYVETVKVSAIQEVVRTPTTPAAQSEVDCFKVPDPPLSGKPRETSPNVEESPATRKRKSSQGGNRKRKAKKLTVPRRKRSNSTDSSDSAGSEPGPANIAPSPGLAHVAPSQGPTYVVSSPCPAQVASSPGPAQIVSSPCPTYRAPSHTVPSPLQLTSQVSDIMSRAAQIVKSVPVENELDQMSPEIVQNVMSTSAEMNMSQYAVVDLGHVQTPATISLVTSDGEKTAVASTVMPNFNIMTEFDGYTQTSQTVPVYQEAGSAEAAGQHQLPKQPLVQQQHVPQEQLVQLVQQKQLVQQEVLQKQLPQQQQIQQPQQVPQEQLPQPQQIQNEQLLHQQPYQQEPSPHQDEFQQPLVPQEPQQQIQQEQSLQEQQIQQQQQIQQPQQQVPQEQLTEQQEADQAACMLQSVYQLEPLVSTSFTYSSPQCTTVPSAAPSQQHHQATPTSSLQSTTNQPAAAVAAPSVETQDNLQEASSKQIETTPVLPTSSVPAPSHAQSTAPTETQPQVSSSQTSRSVSRCLYTDEKTPTSKAVGAGKVAGVTPLAGSPFYSHPETPSLGAQEVVSSDGPAAATPAPPKSAAHQLHINETPLSSKSKSGRTLAEPSSFTGKSLTKDFCHSPGSARTRCTWPRIQSRSAAKRAEAAAKEPVSVPVVESETKLDSPTKENKTPDKVPPQGGGTPLATKEAEVAATMVAMATTPVKDRDGPLYSYLPDENAQTVLPSNEQKTHAQTETQVQSDTESNMQNAPRTDRVYKTPKKQRLCASNAVSPVRSPLLKSLIQVSTGALLNGHNGTGSSPTRGSPVKRQLNIEKSKDVRHSKSKRPRIAKMDVDKFLEKVHSPNPQRNVP